MTFSVVALLGLGTALAVSTFGIVYYIVTDSLPYPDTKGLVFVNDVYSKSSPDLQGVSEPEIFDYRRLARSFQGLAAIDSSKITIQTSPPHRVNSAAISSNLLSLLGVKPVLGRDLNLGDESLASQPVALVSSRLYEKLPSCRDLGNCYFTANGTVYYVVGVLSGKFKMPDALVSGETTDVLLPMRLDPANLSYRDNPRLTVFGRLKPDVELSTAQQEMSHIAQGLRLQYPRTYTPDLGFIIRVRQLRDAVLGDAQYALLTSTLAALFLFLIAATNAANILLVANEERIASLLVALALGAPLRVLRTQLLAEAILLSMLSLIPGAALGWILFWFVARFSAGRYLPLLRDASFSPEAAGFTVLILGCAALLMFVIPQTSLARSRRLLPTMQRETRSMTAGRSRVQVQSSFLMLQTAFSTALIALFLVIALSQLRLRDVDLGFKPGRVQVADLTLSPAEYKENPRVLTFFDSVSQRLALQSSFQATCLATSPPLVQRNETWPFEVATGVRGSGNPPPSFAVEIMSGDCLRVLKIRLLEGSDLSRQKRPGVSPVALVSASLAAHLWSAKSVIGQRFRPRLMPNAPWVTVIGVVADIRHEGPIAAAMETVYLHYDDIPTLTSASVRDMKLLILPTRSTTVTRKSAERAVHEVDPTVPVEFGESLAELGARLTAPWKFTGQLLTLTSLLGPVIALSGLYSLLSTLAIIRRREFGIRIALGATQRNIFVLLSRKMLSWLVAGGVVGIVVAMFLFIRLAVFLPGTALPESIGLSLLGFGAFFIVGILASASLVPSITARSSATYREV